MELLDLVAIAFRRGCGLSLEQAEETERFNELTARFSGAYDVREGALVELLGESLITAAADCLPPVVASAAQHWSTQTADEQFRILELTKQQMLHKGRTYPNRGLRGRQRPAAVLPKEYGRLGYGPFQPSCMGMGAALMAFAQLTGARHGLVQVLLTNQAAILRIKLSLYEQTWAYLRQALPRACEDGLDDRLRQRVEGVAKDLVRIGRYDFHPALVIRLADGGWALLDPYMRLVAKLDPEEHNLDELLDTLHEAGPGRAIIFRNTSQFADVEARLVKQELAGLQAITQSTCDIITQCEAATAEPVPPLAKVLAAGRNVEVCSTAEPFAWLKPVLGPVDALALTMFGLHGDRFRVFTERHLHVAEARLDRDPEYVELAIQRLLSKPFREWLNQVTLDLARVEREAPHLALELALPANGVAVGVLNNLKCWLEPAPLTLGGALARHSTSQTIWHDAMLEPPDSLSPEVRDLLEKRRQALSGLSWDWLHPYVGRLLAALATRNGAVHAQ